LVAELGNGLVVRELQVCGHSFRSHHIYRITIYIYALFAWDIRYPPFGSAAKWL
jgi:hypothetical protein